MPNIMQIFSPNRLNNLALIGKYIFTTHSNDVNNVNENNNNSFTTHFKSYSA